VPIAADADALLDLLAVAAKGAAGAAAATPAIVIETATHTRRDRGAGGRPLRERHDAKGVA
jgi:hypothetical protein